MIRKNKYWWKRIEDRAFQLINDVKIEREKLFLASFPTFYNLDHERRELHLKLATISATIGS